jgi:hypothetical protein
VTKRLSPRRAVSYAAFQARQREQRTATDAIWVRAKGACEVCHAPVSRPGTISTAATIGFLVFTDPAHPSADTGKLLCKRHYAVPRFR